MNPQFTQVSGNASVFRSTVSRPPTCSSETRSSQPCHSSPPQNGQLIRAPRLLKKSKIFTYPPVHGRLSILRNLSQKLLLILVVGPPRGQRTASDADLRAQIREIIDAPSSRP